METDNRKQHPPDGEIGAVIPHEILSRTDLPLFVKLVYGRVAVILRRSGYAVLTTGELPENAESAMDLPGKPCITLSCSA